MEQRSDTSELLKRSTLFLIVGPSAVGKSAIVRRLESSGINRLKSITTRKPRKDDKPNSYDYVSHEEFNLLQKSNNILNPVTHPTSGEKYGTDLQSVTPGVNIIDALVSSVGGFQDIGFGQIKTVGIVAIPEEWLRRVQDRFSPKDPQYLQRLIEAKQSVKWIIENADYIIDNSYLTKDQSALVVQEIILSGNNDLRNNPPKNPHQTARELLSMIDNLKQSLYSHV